MAFLAQSSDRVEEKLVEERCKAATEEFMVRVSKLGLIANITVDVDSSPIQIKSITSID